MNDATVDAEGFGPEEFHPRDVCLGFDHRTPVQVDGGPLMVASICWRRDGARVHICGWHLDNKMPPDPNPMPRFAPFPKLARLIGS